MRKSMCKMMLLMLVILFLLESVGCSKNKVIEAEHSPLVQPLKDEYQQELPIPEKEEEKRINIVRRRPVLQYYDYQAIDMYTLDTPKENEESLESLASYLKQFAKNDQEKARAIFRWITDRIAYDVEAYFSGNYGDLSPDAVLKKRKSVCYGYSALFEKLGLLAGLDVKRISGYGKGYSYVHKNRLDRPNHEWNVVKIQGYWYLLDATWGAGYLNGMKFVKKFDPFYFFTPPEHFIYEHFPESHEWQLLRTPIINLSEFKDKVHLRPCFFKYRLSADKVEDISKKPSFRDIPLLYDYDKNIFIHNAPLEKYLQADQAYFFKIESSDVLEAAVINGGEFYFMKKEGGTYSGNINAKPGALEIRLRFRDQTENFWSVLVYVVEED